MVIVLKQYHRVTSEDRLGEVENEVFGQQVLHPAMQVYFDGCRYAIVGRPNRTGREIRDGIRLREGAVLDSVK